MEMLAKLESELSAMYDYNTAQYNYKPNPTGQGMYASNKEWRGSPEQKQLYKKITQQQLLIRRRKRKLGLEV